MCALRLPIEVTLLAILHAIRGHGARGFLGLRDAPGVRPSRTPVRDDTEDAKGVEQEEPEGRPGGQREAQENLMVLVGL